jgi:sugar phosphate isomerase/epimerase
MSILRRYAIGYSTCGFAPGRDMLTLVRKLGALGYEAVELELDRERLHPEVHSREHALRIAEECRRLGLRMAIGTGARHVLTAQRHEPGCVSRDPAGRRRWIEFIKRSIDLAGDMRAECVMLHSGYAPAGASHNEVWAWLISGTRELAEYAAQAGQRLAFEWHPEMFLRTASDYRRLAAAVDSPAFGLTLDVGHAHCTESAPLPTVILELSPHTVHVQLEDMRNRVHRHLRLGEGQIDFAAVFDAFDRSAFSGIIALEFNAGDLGGNGDDLAADSIAFLRDQMPSLWRRP